MYIFFITNESKSVRKQNTKREIEDTIEASREKSSAGGHMDKQAHID